MQSYIVNNYYDLKYTSIMQFSFSELLTRSFYY